MFPLQLYVTYIQELFVLGWGAIPAAIGAGEGTKEWTNVEKEILVPGETAVSSAEGFGFNFLT